MSEQFKVFLYLVCLLCTTSHLLLTLFHHLKQRGKSHVIKKCGKKKIKRFGAFFKQLLEGVGKVWTDISSPIDLHTNLVLR